MAEKQERIIDQILALTDVKKIITELTKDQDYIPIAEVNQEEYDGKHKILNRDNKEIGEGDTAKTVITAKLVTTFQKLITNLAVAFLIGRPVKYVLDSEDNTEEAFSSIKSVFDGNKMQYFDRKIARATMIETRAAELWYARNDTFDSENPLKPGDPGYVGSKIGVQLLSLKNGFKLYPHFDQYGDMDAFTVTYDMDVFDKTTGKVVQEARTDVYTADATYKYVEAAGGAKLEETVENPFGKIPIIYYAQEDSEWSDVQSLIDRYEDLISNHADENDYYASPMIKVKGKLVEMPDKTQTGKMLKFDAVPSPDQKSLLYGDAEYLTWDQEPESLKLEGNNLRDLIYTLTSTPDVSFSSVKGISTLSGIALKLLFFDATLKSMNHQEVFGEGFMRRVNLVKEIVAFTAVASEEQIRSVEVTVKFQDPTPQDIAENIKMLTEGRAGQPVMSEKTALRNNLLVTDVGEEEEQMEEERKQEAASFGFEAGSFNV